uniref:Uncharacterized protein n=1 Tax=Nelumbo nucifera TaxID=4432 RepID=A0A822ZBQ2_NELNU|nr:TPA_asm: hypothetical protein HUJ06_013290 [Nelumbo nucifera]
MRKAPSPFNPKTISTIKFDRVQNIHKPLHLKTLGLKTLHYPLQACIHPYITHPTIQIRLSTFSKYCMASLTSKNQNKAWQRTMNNSRLN